MARKRTLKPRRAYLPSTPVETAWIESDSYDRKTWADLARGSDTSALVEAGERLIPHFGALLGDLFAALFKYNIVWLESGATRASARLNRTILEHLLPSPAFEALKDRTVLEEEKAAIAALALAEQAFELVRSERLLNRREMLDLWDLKHQEDDLAKLADLLRQANSQQPQAEEPQPGDQAELAQKLQELREATERGAQTAEARLKQKARMLEDSLSHTNKTELRRLELTSSQLTDQIERIAQDVHDFSLEFGQAGRLAAEQRLELGRRLARNKKIAELARLVGRFKQEARALRRQTLERGASEVYDIEGGDDLGRLIPAELVALYHPLLSRDFKRRLIEKQVLQYQLRQEEEKGKGPMVVCLDVSSSMAGDKELWGKAVTLTLMDIARRQRRLFRAVLFSSGPDNLKVLDLNRERRYEPELAKVLELAEYFPGGGTDFESPLDAAVALLQARQMRRGDIVIITDGESKVGAEWLTQLKRSKQELDFRIFAVLVDIGSSELSTLAQIADRVAAVSQLSREGTRDIFLNV